MEAPPCHNSKRMAVSSLRRTPNPPNIAPCRDPPSLPGVLITPCRPVRSRGRSRHWEDACKTAIIALHSPRRERFLHRKIQTVVAREPKTFVSRHMTDVAVQAMLTTKLLRREGVFEGMLVEVRGTTR